MSYIQIKDKSPHSVHNVTMLVDIIFHTANGATEQS